MAAGGNLMLNDAQKKIAAEIWAKYVAGSKKPVQEGSDEMPDAELDARRLEVIPQAQQRISTFVDGKMSLGQFKTENDSLNKKHPFWGFRGMNGQMYFNMLYNVSEGASQLDRLESLLHNVIQAPRNIRDAKSKIVELVAFSDSLAAHVPSKSKAPRTGSCLFFISYFWQIQNRKQWPVYYRSAVGALAAVNIWTPSGDYPDDYEGFCMVNTELTELFTTLAGHSLSLWDVEHAFWVAEQVVSLPLALPGTDKTESPIADGLPNSLIPPAVSILPLLANNDPAIEEMCKRTSVSLEKALEDRTALLLKMLGYRVEILGQGQGRVPDGIAISDECRYAIIYDTKSRRDGYTMGTDDRAIREYIIQATERLRKGGTRKFYFVIVSSSFCGEFDEVIRSLKTETDIAEVLLIEAPALLILLEEKLRNPELELGANGVQGLLARSGVVTAKDMTDFLGA